MSLSADVINAIDANNNVISIKLIIISNCNATVVNNAADFNNNSTDINNAIDFSNNIITDK